MTTVHCPYCKNEDTKVLDSRVADDGGSIRRRRTCAACDRRFTTVEKMQLTVLKRSGGSIRTSHAAPFRVFPGKPPVH